MAFPTIPTVAAGRVLFVEQADTTATRTFPSLTGLTKNAGDLLLALIVAYESSVTDAAFSSWGASFTEFLDTGTSTTVAIGAASKVSDGTETGTFSVTQAATITGHANMCLLSIPGAQTIDPPEGGGSAASTNSNADAGSLTPSGWDASVIDTLWITVCGVGETATAGAFQGVINGPTGWSDFAEGSISADVVGGMDMGVAFLQSLAASVDPAAFNSDTSNSRWRAATLAVRGPATFSDPPSLHHRRTRRRMIQRI